MKSTKLSDIASLTVGFVGTMAQHYVDSGIPFLRSLNIKPFYIDNTDLKYISASFSEELSKSILHEKDIVIVRTGIPGTCCVVPKEYDGCNCADVVIVHPDFSKVNPYYLAAYINVWGQKQILNNKVGAIQQHFNVHTAEEMLVFLPDKETQDCVANLICSVNEKIQLNERLCAELEAMAKTLYDYWFVQFDFPDENGKPYRTSGGAMEWCQKLGREVPKGWKVCRLPEVSSVQYGFPLSTEQFSSTGNRVVRIRDIIDNSYSALTNEAVNNEYFTQEGDLLVGMDGNFQMNYWTRNSDIVNQRITRIRKTVIPIMLIKMQIQPYITAKIDTVARSTVGHLGDADFSERYILVPEGLDIEIFDDYLSKIVSLRKESQELSDLRDWLLPMLMNEQAQVEK